MSEELKACPFCGEGSLQGEPLHTQKCYFTQCCTNSGRNEIIKAWNTRPIEDAIHKELDEWEVKEAACCPEDFGFEEVIKSLQTKLDVAVEALRKYATAGNWNEYTYFDGEYAGGQLAEEALKRLEA